MRGTFDDRGRLFSYVSPEQRVSARHTLRKIRELVREVSEEMLAAKASATQRITAGMGKPTTSRNTSYACVR